MHVKCNLVSIVSLGAELGRPPMCFDAEQVEQHHQTFSIQMLRHQVGGLDCATDLLDLELYVLLFLLQPKVLCLHVFDCAAPAVESQPACYCSIRPDSHVSFVSHLSFRVSQLDGFTRTAYHAVALRFRAAQ